MTRSTRGRFITAVLVANSVLWVLFWGYFLWGSEPAPAPLSKHLFRIYHTHPEYVSVLGRALQDGFPKPIVVGTVLVQFPSFLVAYPLGHYLPGDVVFAQTNHRGLMLLLVTALSYGQWYLVGITLGWLVRRRVSASRIPAH
jgi:hypothetical protein